MSDQGPVGDPAPQGSHLVKVLPTKVSLGLWARFQGWFARVVSDPEVRDAVGDMGEAALAGAEGKLRQPAVQNAQFEAETRKAHAEAQRAEAETELIKAQTAKVWVDTEEAVSKRIREELTFLVNHGLVVTPVVLDGRLAGVRVCKEPPQLVAHEAGEDEG